MFDIIYGCSFLIDCCNDCLMYFYGANKIVVVVVVVVVTLVVIYCHKNLNLFKHKLKSYLFKNFYFSN